MTSNKIRPTTMITTAMVIDGPRSEWDNETEDLVKKHKITKLYLEGTPEEIIKKLVQHAVMLFSVHSKEKDTIKVANKIIKNTKRVLEEMGEIK